MMMGQVEAQPMQWFAVRVKHKQIGGIRTVTVGGEFETYRTRQGQIRKRRVEGTGKRVFLPEHLLRRAGFEVFLPVRKVSRPKNRFTKDCHLVTYPLLTDWMFVGWPAGQARWHEMMDLDVISGVLGTGGRPVAISPDRMQRLMRRWGGGLLSPVCETFMKSEPCFQPGDWAVAIDGNTPGARVRVIEDTGASVRAVLKILGREVTKEFKASDLEPDVKPAPNC